MKSTLSSKDRKAFKYLENHDTPLSRRIYRILITLVLHDEFKNLVKSIGFHKKISSGQKKQIEKFVDKYELSYKVAYQSPANEYLVQLVIEQYLSRDNFSTKGVPFAFFQRSEEGGTTDLEYFTLNLVFDVSITKTELIDYIEKNWGEVIKIKASSGYTSKIKFWKMFPIDMEIFDLYENTSKDQWSPKYKRLEYFIRARLIEKYNRHISAETISKIRNQILSLKKHVNSEIGVHTL